MNALIENSKFLTLVTLFLHAQGKSKSCKIDKSTSYSKMHAWMMQAVKLSWVKNGEYYRDPATDIYRIAHPPADRNFQFVERQKYVKFMLMIYISSLSQRRTLNVFMLRKMVIAIKASIAKELHVFKTI